MRARALTPACGGSSRTSGSPWDRAGPGSASRMPLTVRVLGRRAEPEEAELADLHAGPEHDRQRRDVGQLEGDVAGEARVDEAGRRVGQQAEPAERALALDARGEVVGQRHGLERRAEDELARVQDERVLVRRRPRRAASGRAALPPGRCRGTCGCRRAGRTCPAGRRRSRAGPSAGPTGRARRARQRSRPGCPCRRAARVEAITPARIRPVTPALRTPRRPIVTSWTAPTRAPAAPTTP